jgi:hypothetical protein
MNNIKNNYNPTINNIKNEELSYKDIINNRNSLEISDTKLMSK